MAGKKKSKRTMSKATGREFLTRSVAAKSGTGKKSRKDLVRSNATAYQIGLKMKKDLKVGKGKK